MINLAIAVFRYFRQHAFACWLIFILFSLGLLGSLLRLNYNEDISDFLPLDKENQTALAVYQQSSGANNIYAVISADIADGNSQAQPETLTEVANLLADRIRESDTLHLTSSIITEIDLDHIAEVQSFVYDHIPLFLTDEDYARIDSLLAEPDFISNRLTADKEMLMFPTSALTGGQISVDPLGLFTPVMQRLSVTPSLQSAFDTYDGHFMTSDHSSCFVIINSNLSQSDSDGSRKLLNMLNVVSDDITSEHSDIRIDFLGAPVIAVGNADRIKTDSIWAVAVASVLIIALLVYVFRRPRNILLIFFSVGWGWIFALGILGFFYNSVSLIVIGISSVIVGIAVNYPLHLIDHLKGRNDRVAAIKEIISPLVVGNITTVGAFLALIPLNSKALHDLGLFSSLLLIGTILFTIFILPQLIAEAKPKGDSTRTHFAPKLITTLAQINPKPNRLGILLIGAVTIFLGYFSLRTDFDSDLHNINYIPEEQRVAINRIEQLFKPDSTTATLYLVAAGNDWEESVANLSHQKAAIDRLRRGGMEISGDEVADFVITPSLQSDRLKRWRDFKARWSSELTSKIKTQAQLAGFSADAFTPFAEILSQDYSPLNFNDFHPLTSTVFANRFVELPDRQRCSVISLSVASDNLATAKSALLEGENCMVFDVGSMNDSIVNTLTNDFNYIGAVCGLIVFIFLWISMRSLRFALVSFIPMMISWIWILGIMNLIGIQFNIVNVILATFIFGQGDDYTIFITEGLVYERKHGRPMLASYKNGIVVSALIMFIGIGVLAFALHPALRSLGVVTIIGMITVVGMAYLIPPILFRFLFRNTRA